VGGKPLILIVPRLDAADSPFIEAVLRHWPKASRPTMRAVDIDQVIDKPHLVREGCAVWIYCEAADIDANALFEVEGIVEESQVPAMITMRDESRDACSTTDGGILIAPFAAPRETLCVMLRTLWSQARAIDDLRTEVRFLQAHQGGLCDQMDKIDEELRLAAQLQREFLPASLPSIGDVHFEVLFRPAGYVSGDIYDVLRLDENHIGFFLGDAVGHGVPAALMTMYIKRSLLTKQVDSTRACGYRIIPPAESLARLNRDMCEQNEGDGRIRFATACYGVINCQTREIEFARAGHPYPMILRHDGTVDTITPEGAMLGVFAEEQFESVRTTLGEGDRFVIFSDGFEVAFPEDRHEGQPDHDRRPHFETEFLDLACGPADQAIARLEAKLDQQAGSLNQEDDMTIVCLAIKSQAQITAVPTDLPHAKAG
jgi:sigma-B regulation protein RsbU (phosphoserine phosphatase)